MSTIAYTPGPWHQSDELSRHGTKLIYAADGILVADAGRIHRRSEEETEANARLISGAPGLLAALIDAEDFVAGFEDDDLQEGINELLGSMRFAIAKATGAAS